MVVVVVCALSRHELACIGLLGMEFKARGDHAHNHNIPRTLYSYLLHFGANMMCVSARTLAGQFRAEAAGVQMLYPSLTI